MRKKHGYLEFEEIINRNVEKLKKRHPNGYSPEYFHQKKGA